VLSVALTVPGSADAAHGVAASPPRWSNDQNLWMSLGEAA